MDIWYKFRGDTSKYAEWKTLTEKFVDLKRPQVGHFEFDQVEICHGVSLPETAHFVQW